MKKTHPVSFVILEVRIYGLAELEHLINTQLSSYTHKSRKVNEPTHHAPKVLIRSFISFDVVLRYGRSERINSTDAAKEHTLMKRITSAIIGYFGPKRTVQRATAVFWRFLNFKF